MQIKIARSDLKITGKLDRETAWRRLDAYQNPLSHCYELALRDQPKLSGSVTIVLTIDRDGKVTSAHVPVDTRAELREVGNCLARRLKFLSFYDSSHEPATMELRVPLVPPKRKKH